MFHTFFRLQAKLSTLQWVLLAAAALAINFVATDFLNSAYAASGFPVPYWEAQLSFDHEKLKGWYGFLMGKQALGRYLYAQYVDFAFIGSVLVLHPSALLAVSRAFPPLSRYRQAMIWAALLSMIAPLADAVENAISFIMLANPTSFEPMLALAYSSVAALKFAMFTFAYVAAGGGLIAAAVFWVARRRRTGSAA